MLKKYIGVVSAALALLLAVPAHAQTTGWLFECIDPENTEPYTSDYGIYLIGNDLVRGAIGLSGSVTYGGENGPCYAPSARTIDAVGGLGFMAGPEGSVQTELDDLMAFSTGMPRDPGDFGYVKILKNGDTNAQSVLFGSGGFYKSFVGASFRYAEVGWADADVDATLEMRIVGDAVRLRWTLLNLQDEAQRLGILFALYTGTRLSGFNLDPFDNTNQSNSYLGTASGRIKNLAVPNDDYIGLTVLPTGRPVRNERRYDRFNPKFPPYAKFLYGQTVPYGIRIDNLPDTAVTPDASTADLFLIGNYGNFTAPGLSIGGNVRLNVFGDSPNNPAPLEEADIFLNETTFVQRFPSQTTAIGGRREIIHYVRSSWSVANYLDPYSIILDAPQLVTPNPDGQNGLTPNPMTFRAYLDNQYSQLDREVELRNVRFSLQLPARSGLVFGPGESFNTLPNGDLVGVKTLDRVAANQIASIDWSVVADGSTFGEAPYSVTVTPTPGPTKTISGTVRISATPRLDLPAGANLVSIPYTFQDTSFEDILKLGLGSDFVAYRYDPDQFGYVPAQTVERGVGYWLVLNDSLAGYQLEGAQTPTDQASGGLPIRLRQGWNLIGNPYSYSIPLANLVVVAEDAPERALTWIDAVNAGFVQSSLAFFQPDPSLPNGGSYSYTTGPTDVLLPHRGYFVFWNAFKPGTISMPPVFIEGLPNSRTVETTWRQTEREWRLQLSARTGDGVDATNYVGRVADQKRAQRETIMKPPTAPNAPVELFIADTANGQPTRLAQAIDSKPGALEWKVKVNAAKPGDVTITWPNLPSVPRNVRFRLTDVATGETRDLRSTSGFTFRVPEAGTREFKLNVDTSGSARPVIGNVVVSRPGRDNNAPVSVSYALSADALVTVRVLSGNGREVFTVTRGRSDSAGQNTVTWALRDQANRAVAPGVYRVEILAETPNGERVRKVVPVNVVR